MLPKKETDISANNKEANTVWPPSVLLSVVLRTCSASATVTVSLHDRADDRLCPERLVRRGVVDHKASSPALPFVA